MDRLQTQLNGQIKAPIQFREERQYRFGNQVWTGSDKNPDHIFIIENNFKFTPQFRNRAIGIAVRLKINDIAPAGVGHHIGLDLALNGPVRLTDWASGIRVTKNAAFRGDRSVTVWTIETGMEWYFENFLPGKLLR